MELPSRETLLIIGKCSLSFVVKHVQHERDIHRYAASLPNKSRCTVKVNVSNLVGLVCFKGGLESMQVVHIARKSHISHLIQYSQ